MQRIAGRKMLAVAVLLLIAVLPLTVNGSTISQWGGFVGMNNEPPRGPAPALAKEVYMTTDEARAFARAHYPREVVDRMIERVETAPNPRTSTFK